ncbi:hypothetical protein L1987_60184 [Smallanthus sonchifolius]|uniref:Uncharacterized protein n=1 Tax=Smallanthus sonchifolius TaxID=185202 RepID=A0ACB9D7I6_9ASTR|nr:hypothetical protein L1987_60184 [Smallanthus sonchifolius]
MVMLASFLPDFTLPSSFPFLLLPNFLHVNLLLPNFRPLKPHPDPTAGDGGDFGFHADLCSTARHRRLWWLCDGTPNFRFANRIYVVRKIKISN